MKVTALTNLEERLSTLPALSKPCYLCTGISDPMPVAVIREPNLGDYLCARCVMEHIACFPKDRASIEQVVDLALRASTLTSREKDVLRLLAQGYDDTESAQALGGIQRSSVAWHVCNIKEKLGISRRTQLVLCALKIGLVDLAGIELSTKVKEDGEDS